MLAVIITQVGFGIMLTGCAFFFNGFSKAIDKALFIISACYPIFSECKNHI